MLAGPRFKSPRIQKAVVAAVMFVLLIASVALAAQIGAARAPQAAIASRHDVTRQDLRFQLPAGWQSVQVPPQSGADGPVSIYAWIDSSRPTRRLGFIRVHRPRPTDAPFIIRRYVPLFMGAAAAQGVQTVDAAIHPHPQLDVLEWAGASQSDGTEPRLHLAADLTHDQQTHFLFYLTDEIQPGEDGRMVLLRNLALLRAVHQSARLMTSPAAP